jgi:hypothetical protein
MNLAIAFVRNPGNGLFDAERGVNPGEMRRELTSGEAFAYN